MQIGDILVYRSYENSGHAVIVYDIKYNSKGVPIDAILRESTSNFDNKSTKITDRGLSYFSKFNENTNVTEGTYRELYLKNSYSIGGKTRNSYIYGIKDRKFFAIIRPLLKDKDGNYIGKYYESTMKTDSSSPHGVTCTGRTLKDYKITDVAKTRKTYSNIYIEKTVDVFNNNVVSLGDQLTYTIKIKNNGSSTYNNLNVIETLSNNVDIISASNGSINNNTIKWTLNNIAPKGSMELKYTVKVKNNTNLIGEKITSTGTVGNIPSGTITNYIYHNIENNQKSVLVEKAKNLLISKNYKEVQFINQVYKDAFDVNLNLSNLKIEELILTTNKVTYYPTGTSLGPNVYTNNTNTFYKMLLPSHYGSLYTDSTTIQLKYWENTNPKTLGRSDRVDTIYKELLKTGDILIIKNEQTASGSKTYETENGLYYLIYISENDKININGKEEYGFIGIKNNGEFKKISTEYKDLQTLLGRDYFVILRPTMNIDLTKTILNVNYDFNKEDNNVLVTIKSNEQILEKEGWNLSEDRLSLSKIYNDIAVEKITVSDLLGNNSEIEINIDKVVEDKENDEFVGSQEDDKDLLEKNEESTTNNKFNNDDKKIIIIIILLSFLIILYCFVIKYLLPKIKANKMKKIKTNTEFNDSGNNAEQISNEIIENQNIIYNSENINSGLINNENQDNSKDNNQNN